MEKWLDDLVAAAKGRLPEHNAPTEGQLRELAQMLEALGITQNGVAAAAKPAEPAAIPAGAPVEALATALQQELEAGLRDIHAEVSRSLRAVFEAFQAQQVNAVAELRKQIDALAPPAAEAKA